MEITQKKFVKDIYSSAVHVLLWVSECTVNSISQTGKTYMTNWSLKFCYAKLRKLYIKGEDVCIS